MENRINWLPMAETLITKAMKWLADHPEYSPARAQAIQLGDMEFAQEVARYLDPVDYQYLDPSLARFVGTKVPLNLNGINTIGNRYDTRFDIDPALHPQGRNQMVFPPGHVFALHAEDANPALWAHEYRHESPRVKYASLISDELNAETYNRYEDLYHAQTPQDRREAMHLLADALYQDSDEEMQPSQRWHDLAKQLAPTILEDMKKRHELPEYQLDD